VRIAFVSTLIWYPWGGSEALWTAAADAAVARGDTVRLVVSDLVEPHARIRALRRAGATVVTRVSGARALALNQRVRRRLRQRLRLTEPHARAVAAFRPDLVVVSGGGPYDLMFEPDLVAWLRRSGTRYRYVANFQLENPAVGAEQFEELRRIYPAAERLFFVSERNLATTRRHLIDPLPNAVVINGCAVFNPVLPVGGEPLPWPDESTWHLAVVGRLEAVKGVELLLHAAAQALGGEDGWHLGVYGQGPERAQLEARTAALGLSARVTFHGFVADFDAILRSTHLVVSTALEEGIPLTLPETLLRGRPVLATVVGGAEDWISPGVTGFLCPVPRIEFIAAALKSAWAERSRWRAMGAAGEEFARRRYRPDDYLQIIA
jgi:glycosyltransferase involved in cell wall biosynthesis